MTGLYRRYGQPQSPSDFREAEIFEILQEDDEPVLFRQAAIAARSRTMASLL